MSIIRLFAAAVCWVASTALISSSYCRRRMIIPTITRHISSNRVKTSINGGEKGRMSDVRLKLSTCGAWIKETERKLRSCQTVIPKPEEIVFDKSLCLTERVGEKTSVSIVDFLRCGEIRFKASDILNLKTAKGYWSSDSDGRIVRMVINRVYSDGKIDKSHYLGSANSAQNDETLYIGGDICVENETCDLNDSTLSREFELTLAGQMFLRTPKEKTSIKTVDKQLFITESDEKECLVTENLFT